MASGCLAGNARAAVRGQAVRRTTLWLAGLLLTAAGVTAQAPPLGARLKLRWGRDTVRFSVPGETHELSIRKYFYAARLANVKLESAKEAGGFMYLLLDVTGPSKEPARSGEHTSELQ